MPQHQRSQVINKVKSEKLYRSFEIRKDTIDQEARTVEVAFSSEEPYARWFGDEILSHDRAAVDMDFVGSGRAPFLVGHNHDDPVGIIEKAWIDSDRKGRALVRFGNSARAIEIFQDVLDGIRVNISVGYQVKKMELTTQDEEKGDTYTVTRWKPFEASLVTVPADTTVGVGRSDDETPLPKKLSVKEEIPMPEDTPKPVDMVKLQADANQKAQVRVAEINALGDAHHMKKEAMEAIGAGTEVEKFRQQVLDALAKKGLAPVETPTPDIGLTPKETQRFSVLRALNALANPGDHKLREAAAFEFECSRAVGETMHRTAQGIFLPSEVMKRDLTVGAGTGDQVVATDLQSGSFIDMLQNKMLINQMGATVLDGLVGDVAIPKQTGGATSYWLAESGAPTGSEQTLAQLALTPKTVGAFTDISRKMLKQSSISSEMFVQNDLTRALALAIDAAAIAGTGADNQPTGILNTSGIGSVAGGTNGLAPTWAHLVALWSSLNAANADFGNMSFLTNGKVAGKLLTTPKVSSTDSKMLLETFPGADGFTNLAGARCGVTNQVPSNLTKGTADEICSAIIFGNWVDLVLAMWGTTDLTVDPYSNSTSGAVRIVALQDTDIGVRNAASFSAMQDALTA